MIPLVFPAGSEFTFAVEGADRREALRPHVPGDTTGSSGVTIGPGYDCGRRTATAIYDDLRHAGAPACTCSLLSTAAGLRGAAARKWLEVRADEILPISPDVARGLMLRIYPSYVGRARHIWEGWGRSWVTLCAREQEALVDLCYRGDLAQRHWARLMLGTVTQAISDVAYWQAHTNLLRMVDGSPNARLTARARFIMGGRG